MSVETYYTVLGVSDDASQKEIKAAYRELVRQVHPDSVPNASPYWKRASEEKTKELNEAYYVLSNESKRREYDRLLVEARQGMSQQSPTTPPPNQPSTRPQAAPSAPPPTNPKRQASPSKPRGIAERVFLFYACIIGAVLAFAVLRTVWVASLCSLVFAALLYRLKMFSQYRWWCALALVVSASFVVADFVYPIDADKSSQIVRDGKYSDFPCEKGQAVSPVDHKPCKPLPVPTKVKKPAPVFEVVDAEPPKRTHQKSVPILSAGLFNIDPMVGYGQIKSFMGTQCSWNNVGVEAKKEAMETGVLADHTFMISPNDETCYVWNRNVRAILAKGGVRGEPIVQNHKIVAYKKPDKGAIVNKPTAEFLSSQHLPSQILERPPEAHSLSSSRPDLSRLTFQDRQSIESVCSHAKYIEGPVAYDRCLVRQFEASAAGPRRPDLSRLTLDEKQSIESVCSHAKYVEGPAAYNSCLIRQLEASAAGPRRPDLSRLTFDEKQSIESVCSRAKYVEGPAVYNKCLVRQLEALVNSHQ